MEILFPHKIVKICSLTWTLNFRLLFCLSNCAGLLLLSVNAFHYTSHNPEVVTRLCKSFEAKVCNGSWRSTTNSFHQFRLPSLFFFTICLRTLLMYTLSNFQVYRFPLLSISLANKLIFDFFLYQKSLCCCLFGFTWQVFPSFRIPLDYDHVCSLLFSQLFVIIVFKLETREGKIQIGGDRER